MTSNMGELFVAQLALGVTFSALAFGVDPGAVEVVKRFFRDVQLMGSARSFSPAILRPFLDSRWYSAVLVAGSLPSQGFSLAGSLQAIPDAVAACRQSLQDWGTCVPVFGMVEHQDAEAELAETMTAAMHGPPTVIAVASFGWVRQAKQFWCVGNDRSVAELLQVTVPCNVFSRLGLSRHHDTPGRSLVLLLASVGLLWA